MTISLPRYIDFETVSTCNRRCPSCIRNSHPDRDKLKSWFEPNYLPIEVITGALDQCKELNFTGEVCLSHYNEPPMDERLPSLVRLVKSYNYKVFFNTNGDLVTGRLASELDGNLDKIIITLYMKEPKKSERKAWLESLFQKTEVQVNTMSDHVPTHFSPIFDVEALANERRGRPCHEQEIRVIINHRRQFLLCCDDVIGNFDLGTFPETSIKDYWFGKKRTKIVKDLLENGGRNKYPYCSTCPRP